MTDARRHQVLLTTVAALIAMTAAASMMLGHTRTSPNAVSEAVARALGPRVHGAAAQHTATRGVHIDLDRRGFAYDAGADGRLRVATVGAGGQSTASTFARGVQRRTWFGDESIAVSGDKAEIYLTVRKQLHKHTWRWLLDTPLEARVSDSGWVGFFDRRSNKLMSVSMPPVKVFDARGHDITPRGLAWGLETTKRRQYLTLALDDSKFSLPYTIDPAAYRTNATASSVAASGTFTLTIPATVNAKDLLLVHESGKATTPTATFPATPTDNTVGGNTWAQVAGTNVAAGSIDQFVWWKWAIAADASKTVTVTIPASTGAAVTTAAVDVYKGLDSTQTGPQDTGQTNSVTGHRWFTPPAITASGATAREHMFLLASGVFLSSTSWPASLVAGGTWAVQPSGTSTGSASSQAMAAYDSDTAANTAFTATQSGNIFGGNTDSVTSAFGFADDVTAPTNNISITNLTGSAYLGTATGSTATLYYKGSAAGSFQLSNAITDAGSGPASSTFPTLGGTTTNWSHTAPAAVTTPTGGPYASGGSPNNFSWTAGATSSPTEAIVGTDNGGNTATTTLTFTNDITATAPSITFPASSTVYNGAGWSTISGSASDAGSGVASNQVSIQDTTVGGSSCWNTGTSTFSAACPNYIATSGTTSWTYAGIGSGNLTSGHSYTVTARTTDNVGNTSTTTTSTFTYDSSAPTTASLTTNGTYNGAGFPSSLTGTATDSGTGSSGISSVNVSVKDSTTGKCWNGTDFATATCPNWNAVTSGGTATGAANASWSYSTTGMGAQLTDGDTYTVQVQATDATTNGNTSGTLSAGTFKYDASAPTASITNPTNNGAYNGAGWPGVSGTAADTTAGVGTVKVSIQKDGGANSCWDGTNAAGHFAAACPNWVTATGTTSWSVALGSAALVNGSTYALSVQTSDSATNANVNSSAATASFSYDTSGPSNASLTTNNTYNAAGWPGSVQGTTNDSGTGSNGISAVSVSIQKDGGASACWNGTSFGSSCPNWVAVTSGGTATGANNATWSYTLASSALTNGSTYAVSVRATDASTNGNQSGALSTSSFAYDTAAPSSASLTTTGNYNAAGWPGSVQGTVSDSGTGSHGISAVDVSIQDSASSKCWNGTNFTTATCPNWVAVTSGNTATGANNASWSYNLGSSALTNGHTYTVSVRATDATTNGNQSGTLAGGAFTYDTTGPTHAVSLSSATGAYYASGTLYYKGDAAGSFTLKDPITDSTSGPASVTYPAIATSGWTHNAETVNSGPNYGSTAYSWVANPGANPSGYSISGLDAAGNTSTASVAFANDTTPPSVTPPSVTAGYYTSLSVPVAKNGGNDTGGSGVDSTTSILERHEANFSNGSCGSFGATWTTITLVGGADATVQNGKCYEYRERLTDNVGNQGTSGVSNIAKVDNAGPSNAVTLSSVSGGAYKAGNTIYYRGATTGGGSFTLTNTLTDGESGPASSATAALGGTSTGWTHTPSTVSTPSGGPYESNTFFWTQGATSSPTEVVTGADAAGNTTASTSVTFVNDSTAPSVTAPTVTAGYYTSASVPVALNGGNDSGSGVLGGSSNVQRDETTLSGGSCNTFPGAWTNVTLTSGNDTTVQNGKCYVYREQLTDRVGNTGSSSASNIVKVDLQGPTNSLSLSSVSPTNAALLVGSRVFYRGAVAGSFKVTNAVADAESGAASSATAALGGTTSGWTHTPSTVSTPVGGPYDSGAFSWNAGTTSAPTEVVTGSDTAGNGTPASSLTFTNDSSAPTGGALTVNGTVATSGGSTSTSTSGSFPIDVRSDYGETQSASESGLASSTLTRQSASYTNGSCGTFNAPSTISGNPSQSLATGCYLFTLTGVDNVGNTVSVSTTVQVDTSAPSTPTLSISNLTGNVTASGTTVMFLPTGTGSFDITASSTDGDSGIAGYTFPTAASMGSGWSVSGSGATRTYTFTAGSAQPGTKSVVATNGVGSTASDTFGVVYSDGTPPTSSILCDGASCHAGYYTSAVSVTLSADDGAGGSGVQVIRYTTDGTDPTMGNGSNYTGAFTVSTDTTVKFRAYDVAANAEAVNTQTIQVDTTAPTGPTLTVTENPASGAQHVVGTTVFYRPGASGTFRVSAATSDPETGVASVDFPAIANVTGGGTIASAPYQAGYTWGSSTSGSASHSVVATNGAGGTSNASFDLDADSTAPTGQTITLTGAGAPYYKTASVAFSLGDGNDGSGSGLDTSTRTVTRESATLSGDSCGTFIADAGTYTSPDTSVSDGHCYRYTFTIKDNVGNSSSGVSATAKVDTTPPTVNVTAPTEVSGGGNEYYDAGTKTEYFRPAGSGSFTLNASASETATDVTGVTFPTVASTSGWSGSTGGTDSSSPFASPNNYVWTSGASAPGPQTVSATDKAGNSATDAITIAADSTAPTGQSITLTGSSAPYFTSASVSFSLGDGSDAESGVDTSSRVVTRETGDLSNGTCSNFTADAGTFTSPDTSVSGAHCYRYTFTIKDNVGNVSSGVSATAKVDTTAPTTPSLSFGAFTNAAATGTTVYLRPGQSGGFTVSSSSSDPESTVASTSFPSLGSGWSNTAGAYSFDTTASAPSGNQNVTSRNGAGIDSANSPFTVAEDTTAPQTTPLCGGGSCAGWFTSSPVAVTLAANDFGGSGPQVIRYTTDGSTPTLANGSDYTGPINIASTTTLKFRAYDRVGNAEATQSQTVQVDTTVPSAPSLTLSESSPYEFVSTSTLFYNPSGSNSGTFTVDGTSADGESSLQKLTFPSLTGMTGGGDDFLSPYQGSYSWDNTATTAPGANNVVAANNAGLTNQTSFTVTKDVTAPTGQSLTLTGSGAPYYKTSSVTFSLNDGNDGGGGSGVDASSETVTRESAALSGDSCGTFTADAGTFTSPDTSVTSGHCYRYTFSVKDNVGNTSAAVTATAKVDTAAPTVSVTAPTELSGAGDQYYDSATQTQYFRSTGSGSFSLKATASDGATAVTGVAFPDVSAVSGWSGSIGGTDSTSPYASPTNYTWTSGASEPASQNVVATDKAGNTSSGSIAITDDTTAPTGQAITLTGANAPWYTSTSVGFSLTDGTDGGSGLDTSSRTVTRETGTLTNGSCSGFSADAGTFTSPDTSVTSGHCYRYTFTIKDNVGNVSAAVTATAKVDATSPSLTVNAPTAVSGAGNQYYDGPSTTLYFRPSGSGSFTLNATSSDADSGISSVNFPDLSSVSGWTFSSPADYSWTSGATAPGARSIVATNGAGLTAAGTITIAADSAAPTGQTISLTGAGAPYYKNTSVTFTLGDGSDGAGSGLDTSSRSVTRETAPLSGDSCGTFVADAGTFTSPDTSVTGGHCYRYTFTIKDNVGNVSTAVTATAKVDTASPNATTSAPTELTGAANQYYDAGTKTQFFRSTASGSFRLNATASDTHTAVANVAFPDVSSTSGWSGSTGGTDSTSPYTSATAYSWSSGASEPGAQTLTATDLAGNTGTDSITLKNDTTAPSGQTITAGATYFASASVTFSLNDGTDNAGGAGVDTTSHTVTRETAPLSGDSCGTFVADAGTFTSPDASVSNGHCYRYTFAESDNVGNVSAPATTTVKVDTASPTVTLTNPGTPLHATVSLGATASDSETGVQQVAFQRSDAGANSWTTIGTDTSAPFTQSWDTTGLTDGLYDLRVIATDGAGNTTTSAVVANRAVDNTAPNTTIDAQPSNPSNNPTPTFQFSSSESGSTFECRIDGGSWSSCSSPDTLGALSNASHTFDVRATDSAGNTDATPASYTWTVDFVAPETTIDSQPSNPSGNASPTFAFSASMAGSTFECRIDGGSWNACSSPDTIGPLTSGSHTFGVRATSTAGNTDPTPASYTWSVDLTAPSVTITAPTTYIDAADPSNYAVTATTPDSDVTKIDFYECSDSSVACGTGTWNLLGTDTSAPYGALWTTPGSDGTRAIRAVATDSAGNTGGHVRTITIDRTAPTGVTISYANGYASGAVTITTGNGPDGDVNASSGTIERSLAFLTNDSCGTFGGYAPVTSPDTVPSGDCAKYEYHVADNAGNVTTVLGSNVVKRDAAAPTSSLSDPGTNLRQTISLSASASDTGGSDIASVAFQRKPSGGGTWTTIGSDTTAPYGVSFDTTTLTDGLYDFRSVATDVAGNSETSPVAVTNRRIDNTAPSATMVTPGNPVRGSVTLTSTTNDGGSGISTVAYEIAPNGGSFSSQTSSWNTTLISDGLYDLRVVATDNAGNTTTSSLVTTRVDNTPPSVSFTSPASNAGVRGTVALTATATDASPASPSVTFEYKLHSAPVSAYAAASASWNTTTLPAGDGVYDLRATASDAAGNVTQVANTSITVDNVPPTISISAPGTSINGSVSSPTAFSATANDAGSGVQQVEFFQCSDASVDCSTGTFSSLGVDTTAPYSTSWNIAPDGNRTLKATATDNAGHTTSATRNVSIDTTAPFTNITGAPGDPSNVSMLTFTSSEAGSTFECRIDGGSWSPCTSPHTFTGLTDNQHTASVRSIDAAGNVDPTPPSWTWHRDATNPTGSLNNPGANVRGTVALTSSETDPSSNGYASGVNAVAYQYSADGTTWATIGIANSAPFDSMSWNTTGVTDGVYQLRIVIGDVAGNVGTAVLPSSVRVDNTPPTTSQDDPGQYLRGTKNLTGSAADSGSGIDHVDFQISAAGANSWTTIGTDTTAPYTTSFDTTGVADGHYDFRTVAVDVAGNTANATPVTSRLVDNTAPNAVVGDPSTSAGYVRGTVTLSSSGTSDPGGADASGIASVSYQYSTDGGTTWNATGTSLNTTTLPEGSLKLRVIATDNAGNSATSPVVSDTIDNTRPVTTDNAPSGYQATPVTVNLNASDAGSGVNVTEYSVDGGPYVAGTSVNIPAPSDGSNDGAHTIAYFSADNVGNVEQAKSTTVLIDATPPACSSCSAADYLRGNVTLSASPATGGSGIQSVQFEYSPAGANTWTPIGTDTTGPAPYTANWDTTAVADGHYDLRIIVTDNANNSTTTDLADKVVDNTAPNVATVGAPTQGAIISGNVGINASAADATSPIASVEFIVRGTSVATDTTAPYSYTWDSTSVADGSTTIQVVVADEAGNTTASPIRTVTVDNNAPSPSLADPGANVHGTVNLSATSDPDTTQIDFERRPAGGSTWTTITSDVSAPFATALDTTTLADGLYDFRAVATDSSGNTGTSGVRSNIRVDNAAPSGTLTAPSDGATVGGPNVALGASASDGGSGVASVSYERRPTGGSSWTSIATSSGAPYSGTWDTTGLTSGNYDLRAVVTDNAGNTFTTPTVTVTVDTVAPTVVLANPGASLSGSATLSAAVTGSGATQVAFFSSHAGANAWQPIATDTSAPYSVAFNTTTVDDGLYDLRAVVTDTHGNTSDSVQTGIRIDNTAPRLVSSAPADGALVGSASSIELVATEAATVSGVKLDGATTVAPVITGTHLLFNTGTLSDGLHVLAGNLADSSGKTSPFRISFTVGSGSSDAAVERNTSSSVSTSLTSADGVATLTVPAGAWSPRGNDWVVVRIDTRPTTGVANGFSGASEILDVTAFWALSGEQIHQFDKPLELFVRSTAAGVVPATFDGNWRVLRRTSGTTLPATWNDGFFRDATGYHLLTRHLTQFTLLKDVQPPAAPTNVLAFLTNGKLSVQWTPGVDNSGTYDYVRVLRDGSGIGDYGTGTTTADLGAWTPSDTRALTLRETDLAGNDSSETKVLRPVPSIVGLSRDAAANALAAAGFKIGDVTEAGNGRPGTVTGPANLALAEDGAAIDITIAPGSGGFTKFAFSVVSTKMVKSSQTRTIAARVSLTRAAAVTTVLYSPRGLKLATWRLKLKAGNTIVKLRIPRQIRRAGTYALRWTATSGEARITRTLRFRLTSRTTQSVRSVVFAGLQKPSSTKGILASSADRAFSVASAGSAGKQVLVVDVDLDGFGLGFVHDLRTVFPSSKIIALSNKPATLARATRAGANIALPRSTPAKTLAAVIAKLLR